MQFVQTASNNFTTDIPSYIKEAVFIKLSLLQRVLFGEAFMI